MKTLTSILLLALSVLVFGYSWGDSSASTVKILALGCEIDLPEGYVVSSDDSEVA